jgi:hypothetical protein
VILHISVRNSLTQHCSVLTRGAHISLAKLRDPYDALRFQHMDIIDSHP